VSKRSGTASRFRTLAAQDGVRRPLARGNLVGGSGEKFVDVAEVSFLFDAVAVVAFPARGGDDVEALGRASLRPLRV